MHRTVLLASLALLMGFVLALVYFNQEQAGPQRPEADVSEPGLPTLSDADYDWIGSRIYQNEALGKPEYLAHWNEGEDFPSLGIGHFIWFPKGVDAPFDEQFPALVTYLHEHLPGDLQMPAWLQELDPLDAPWNNKNEFDAARDTVQMHSLRQWLDSTRQYQAQFIVSRFEERWRELKLPGQQKQQLTALLHTMFETPEGLYAVIDYYNFKGLGNNPRETYQGEGWGLVQVLSALAAMRAEPDECTDIVMQFKQAAAGRLQLRVGLSPPERNETRWLAGWLKRLDGYLEKRAGSDSASVCGFHITPYLQNPSTDAITLIWFSKKDRAGQLTVWKPAGTGGDEPVVFHSSPVSADALAYHSNEICPEVRCDELPLPYLHQVRLTDLEHGTSYRYEVAQAYDRSGGSFNTLEDGNRPLRFVVYADSETEPESTGKHVYWPSADAPKRMRKYPLDQTTGYAQNLKVIRDRKPAFVAIAGDLVQSGGEQRDWNEFWIHNADLASSAVLLPSFGNHDYFAGPGDLGKYATDDSERAVRKYQTYFDLPSNGARDARHSERYYALQHGMMTLIVLDTINGLPDRSEMDTNWRLLGEQEGGIAPDWQVGSEQYAWLESELQKAQVNGRFTFVMFHHAPYTSGVHGRPPGEKPRGDILSGLPLQTLTPLLMRHGVDAVFSGHDEMYEHSLVSGVELTHEGIERAHEIHFYDIGIGGDGLRGPVTDVDNPYQVFLAHTDSPEIYAADGILSDGGKHYGHLEVNIDRDAHGNWQATLDPVYIFPVLQADGQAIDFLRRVYPDSVTLRAH